MEAAKTTQGFKEKGQEKRTGHLHHHLQWRTLFFTSRIKSGKWQAHCLGEGQCFGSSSFHFSCSFAEIPLSGVASYLSWSMSASGLPDYNVTHVSSAHSHFFCPSLSLTMPQHKEKGFLKQTEPLSPVEMHRHSRAFHRRGCTGLP